MKRKLLMFHLLVILTIVTACSTTSTSPTPTPTSTSSAPEQNQNNKVIKLKSSIQSPKESYLSKGFDAFLDTIEEKSEGRIVFERYYAEALIKAADHFQATGAGIADIAAINPSFTPSELPLSSIASLPSLWENMKPGTLAYRALFEKYPEFNEEFEKRGVKVIGHAAYPSFYIITNKEDTNSFEKLKGLKLLAAGYQGVLSGALNATPVGVVLTESFELMEKGTIVGVMLGFSSSSAYGIHEIAKSVWTIPVGTAAGVFGMNLQTYNSLSDDLKKIIDEAAVQNIDDFHEIYQVGGEEASKQKFIEAGVKIIEPKEEEINQIKQLARDHVWVKWIDDITKKGYPAEEILNTYIEEIDKHEAEFK